LLSLWKEAEMINSVRNTVLAIANKNNYGYISPQDFNLYAQQAQIDLFEEYFYSFNSWINKRNQRTAGSGYADVVKGLEEVIDSFSVEVFLTLISGNVTNIYSLPTDYYLINKLYTYLNPITNGTATAPTTYQLEDGTATFITDGISPGDIVILKGGEITTVNTVSSEILLMLSEDILAPTPTNNKYTIYPSDSAKEIERVSQNKITFLLSSLLTTPTNLFPSYTLNGDNVTAYPMASFGLNKVRAQYIRYPLAPKWTYSTLTGGAPLFDQSQADYQDFELPLADEPTLVAKICQYVGITIREEDVYAFGNGQITTENQTES